MLFILGQLTLLATAAVGSQRIEVQQTNLSPVPIDFSIAYVADAGHTEVLGALRVLPGDQLTTPVWVPGGTRQLFVYGESVDAPVNRRVLARIGEASFGSPSETWYFQAEEGEPTAWIRNLAHEPGTTRLPFAVKAGIQDSGPIVPYKGVRIRGGEAHVVSMHGGTPWVLEPGFDDSSAGEVSMNRMRQRARALSLSLRGYHHDFMAVWNSLNAAGHPTNPGCLPAILGIQCQGKTVPESLRPGIRITDVTFPLSLWGDPLPYRIGDTLLKVNDRMVFGVWDIALALYHHSLHGPGIEEPVELLVQASDGSHEVLRVTYRFDEKWASSIVSRGGAFRQGAVDVITFGNGAAATEAVRRGAGAAANALARFAAYLNDEKYKPAFRAKISSKRAVFLRKQFMAAGRQLWPDEYSAGEMAGIIGPNPASLIRAPLRRFTTGAVGSRALGRVLSSGVLTGAEAAIAGYHAASPLLPRESKLIEAQNWGRVGALMGGAMDIAGSALARTFR